MTAVSRTAEAMALFRALETLRPASERVFADPFAARFLRPPLRVVLLAARLAPLRRALLRFIDRRWPGARSAGVARTRFIDDALRGALGSGCRQLAILGAGFDARAWRLPELTGIPVFELDREATQRAKRARLGSGAAPRFVAVDLGAPGLERAFREAGFDPRAPTCFLFEGVSNYLDAPAVDATLRFVGAAAPGSVLIFTYVHRGLLDGSVRFPGTGRLGHTLAHSGERWSFGLDPHELRAYLALRGLALAQDLDASEVRARVLGGPGHGYEFYHVALARVSAEGAACRR